ncbi:MAG TPA: hypothetical protein VM030_04900 [Acidimicrobiales bacterium]|nr:hypothetical protein [Acidimicrobiales bacterium]
MVLLFLAGIWAAVLIPPVLRARAEGRPADSIGSFRRQLHVLERTGPTTVAPANRLGPMASLTLGGPERFVRPAAGVAAPVAAARPRRDSLARKRRRDVFQALLAAMAGSLLLGLIPSLRVMLGLHLVLDLVFAGYVALLVRMRNAAAEREMKLRFLPSPMASREPALALRRSAN